MSPFKKSPPRIVYYSILIALAYTLAPGLSSEGKKPGTIGSGSADIAVAGDKAKARRLAIKSALGDAVERRAGFYIRKHSVVKDGQIVLQEIRATASGYVKSYEVLNEKILNGLYVVRVRAVIDEKALSDKFSRRLSRHVARNLFGKCRVSKLTALYSRYRPRMSEFYCTKMKRVLKARVQNFDLRFRLSFACSLLDPTVDPNSLSIKLAGLKWKPRTIRVSGNGLTRRVYFGLYGGGISNRLSAKRHKQWVPLLDAARGILKSNGRLNFQYRLKGESTERKFAANLERVKYFNLQVTDEYEKDAAGRMLSWKMRSNYYSPYLFSDAALKSRLLARVDLLSKRPWKREEQSIPQACAGNGG